MMETLQYILKANIAFVILYMAYRLMLHGTARFAANRAWLLLLPVAAFTLPLVTLPSTAQPLRFIELPTVSIGGSVGASAGTTFSSSMGNALFMLYGMGVLFTLVLLAVRYARAWRLSAAPSGDAKSFFGRIVLPAGPDGDEHRTLAAHERAHADLGHSYDVLYMELMSAISWWNPLWRWALRDLRTVHELQADSIASPLHPDYGRLLLSHALGVPESTLVNSFRSSNLKARIAMLSKKRSRYSAFRYAIVAPALVVALFAASCVRSVAPPSPPVPPAAPATPAQPVLDLSEVEVQPEFPGGMAAMYAFLGSTIKYPDQAFNEKVQGKVYVEFTVGADGQVRDVKLRRGIRKDLDDEALRGIRAMPDWTPGQVGGKAVATRFTVPVVFKLKGKAPPQKP